MKNNTPVAVASRSFSKHPVLREELLKKYENVTFNEKGESLHGKELIEFLRGHTKAITALESLDETLFSSLPELRVIGKYGVGMDMIDLEAMERHGVSLGWTGGVNKRSVSELVISSAIALLHRAPVASAEVKAGKWRQIKGNLFTEKTLGIVGCGHIGKDVARLSRAFHCKILAHDILDFPEFYSEYGVEAVGLEELLKRSDIVTLHLPLDPTTKNILNADRLELLKPSAIVMNLARGGLLDEIKITGMLKEKRLGGAAFDVFAQEPPDDNELINLPNVIVTPHIGGSSEEAILAMGRSAIAGLDSAILPSEHFGINFKK
ncbi:Phosphoglycerate dehydrogenase [Candidatus Desulfarcum epimagneticum]|uniref:Phosphoglycerate dehydrogenase n=1 Tax=uncultured Desulfobacteraceae bacterium TaxID=218296 RepID=A0A484HJS4_9BACT|nr:Phosphoglycerate dehydrogenase [uncultured Desulfobacteraceae bacterium]